MKHLLQVSLWSIVLLCYSHIYSQQVAKAKTKDGVTKIKGQGGQKEKGANRENLNISGAYAMYRQVVNDGTKDSAMGSEQMKLFSDRYVMYAHKEANDSFGVFGIGTYKIKYGKVIEEMFYTSSGGAHNDTFELDINKTRDGYTQIIDFPEEQGRRFRLTEDYNTIGKNVSSVLDGAWKQIKSESISKDGETLTNSNPTQYKMFQSGHFIWGNTSMDSATQKPVSFFGYGTFKMNGNNQVIEVNTNSSYATALIGKPVTLDIKFTDTDHYQQTIVWPDGWKQTEYYERLK